MPPADAAGLLFETYATQLWEVRESFREEPLLGRADFGVWVTYPVRCVRVAEILGLLSLHVYDTDPDLAAEIGKWLVAFMDAQPGVSRPLSDLYAVSVIPAVLAIALVSREGAERHLTRVAVWMADQYERDQLGLAGVDATPQEEIERILGAPFEIVGLEKRRESLLASTLLDLAATLQLATLYGNLYNDVQAVGIYPYILRLGDGPDQYLATGYANRLDPNVDFAEELALDTQVAPHRDDEAGEEQVGAARSWDLIAIGSAMRDRYFVRALDALGVMSCE